MDIRLRDMLTLRPLQGLVILISKSIFESK